MLEGIFDFEALKKLFKSDFTMKFDAMNAVTGPYGKRIFEEILGAAPGSVINAVPKPDFGGLHPDPNMVYAKELIGIMYGDDAPDFGSANDGDGDRNMILGRKFFVSPSDSLSIITDNYKLIPAYRNGIYGVAKSAATSTAVCRTAKALGMDCYEVPTGWKYFVNLMDSNRITFCGEESFGTGSSHIREKDGIWAILFWLSISAATGKSVEEITVDHWKKYGRSYYIRFDFEGIDKDVADKLMADLENRLPGLNGKKFGSFEVSEAAPFVYNDPVDGSSTKNGLVVKFADGSRIVYRLSGTGTSGPMSLHSPYITLTGFITALAFSASAYAGLYGFTSANPYTYEEQILDIKVAPKTIVNYRKAMRDNVVALAEFAKAENKNFEIIAHEGEELLHKSLWEYHLDGYNEARRKGINADDPVFLAHLKQTEPDLAYSASAENYGRHLSGIAVNNRFCGSRKLSPHIKEHGLKIISIDSCSSEAELDEAIMNSAGFGSLLYAFVKPETAFRKIKTADNQRKCPQHLQSCRRGQHLVLH